MGEVKFTPGPWHWNAGQTYIELLTLGNRVCVLGAAGNSDDIDLPTDADAHLIAAAPLMYAELEKAYRYLAWVGRLGVMSGIDDEEIGPITRVGRDIHAALAKARGDE